MDEQDYLRLVLTFREALTAEGIADALVLRKVLRLRELLQVFDRELSELQRLVTGAAEAEVPPV